MSNLGHQLGSQLGHFINKLPFHFINHRFFALPTLIKWAKIPKGAHVLEVGCGDGKISSYLSEQIKCKSYTAIDKDPNQIASAEAKGNLKTVFQVADINNLPFENGSFDVIICLALLHHILDWKKALREMHRVLKKNGRLLLKEFTIETFTLPGIGLVLQQVMLHPYDHMFDQIELLTHIRKTGFEINHQNDSLFSLVLTATKKDK